MNKTLKISEEIELPLDAVTQTMAAIGRKGAGKTYLSQMIAEQMIDQKAQIVVVDPVGVWWGLRVNADGKRKGKEIFVIGGDHGDVPLVPEAGRKIAQLIIEKGISAVLDVSEFGIGERKRFCADFGEEFFQLKKKKRTPVHMFLEEAQLVVPQQIRPEEGRMYSAFEQIVRLGRNYGIGTTLITQRPQSVNKEVLSQVECLCVLQITGPHERKALEYWVQEAGVEKPRTLIGELPGLQRGEGYVWSPAWLKIFDRVHFSKKQTFDASATPELGKKAARTSLSAVDVERLRADMQDVVAQAERDDPVALRKRIAELEKDGRKTDSPMGVSQWMEYGKRYKYDEYFLDQARKGFEKQFAEFRSKITILTDALAKISKIASGIDLTVETNQSPKPMMVFKDSTPAGKVIVQKVAYIQKERTAVQEDSSISGPEQRVINAIALLNQLGVPSPLRQAVAFVAQYKYGAGSFNNPCGQLRSKGLVEYRGPEMVLTKEGVSYVQIDPTPPSIEELHQRAYSILPGPERRLLEPLINGYPNEMSNEELAEASRYVVNTGGFNNPRGKLHTLGLIEYTRPGFVRAADILFPGGAF